MTSLRFSISSKPKGMGPFAAQFAYERGQSANTLPAMPLRL